MFLYEKALWYFNHTNMLLMDMVDALSAQYGASRDTIADALVWAMGKYYGLDM